jgi:hypothetical protein
MAASRHQIQNSKQLRRPVVRSQVPNHHHPTIRNRTACLAAFSQQLLIKHARTDRDPRAQRTGQLLPKSSQSWPPDSNGPTTLPRRSARSVRLPKLAAEIVDPKRHERAREREKGNSKPTEGEWCGTHGVAGLHPDLEVRALQGLHRQLHGGSGAGSRSSAPAAWG